MPQPSHPTDAVRSWYARNELIGTVLLNAIIALVTWGLAELVLMPTDGALTATPIWPPAGIAVAVIYIFGYRVLPAIVLASLLVGVFRDPRPVALIIALAQVIQPIVDVRILRALRFDPRLERVRDPLIVACAAAPIGAVLAATLANGHYVIAGQIALDRAPYEWLLWVLREWLGVIVFAPLVFTWAHGRAITRSAATVAALVSAFAIVIGGLGLEPFFLFLSTGSLGGMLLAAIIAERDDAVAKRLLLEEQLRHSQKMEAVGRLAGGVAHDFNNLLTAIIGYTEIVLHDLDPKDDRRADAEEIGRAAMRAADLTRQMLAFSRRQARQPKIVDLNKALTKVEPMLRRMIGEDIVVTVNGRAAHPYVRVDPGQVEQVVMNLVVNARDAMPKGGRLSVDTAEATLDAAATADIADARPGDYVVLSVSDTGVGMPPEVCDRIFEPYFTTKDVGKGTGLGLSTAYGIVRQSDGHIALSSEVGLGTTFRVYLPRAEAPQAPAVDAAAEKLPEGAEHILLVEDDSSVRRLVKELLVRLGYSVTEAASGRAGLALGSDDTRHFDLALCDVILGDMSGAAVAEALGALRPSIRVLYMSGYTDEAIVRTGVLDEGKPFLQKPFTPLQLSKKIREVLDQPETGLL